LLAKPGRSGSLQLLWPDTWTDLDHSTAVFIAFDTVPNMVFSRSGLVVAENLEAVQHDTLSLHGALSGLNVKLHALINSKNAKQTAQVYGSICVWL
jgi:hypothetical protein